MGNVICKGIGRKVSTLNIPLKKREYMPFIKTMKEKREKHKPSFRAVMSYQVQRVLAKKILTIDKEYWEEKGWAKQLYFYSCRMGPIKKIVAILLYGLLSRVIRKASDNPYS